MGLFRRESTWSRLTDQATKNVPTKALTSGVTAVGTFVGATLISAAVSAARRRQENA